MNKRSLEVQLGTTGVGGLVEREDARIGFRFTDTYRGLENRPILSQSFEDDLGRTYWGKRATQLPAFFANLLPEGRLRAILEETLGIVPGDDLALLLAVGHDLPGAVAVSSSTTEDLQVNGNSGRNGTEDVEAPTAVGLRFSLAGVQLKFSVLFEDGRLTMPAHGQAGDWIVKIGSDEYPGLAENEFAMLEWARASGHDVPECQLMFPDAIPALTKYAPAGSRLFAIRRFDRPHQARLHQEDFAQVFGLLPARKYDETYERVGIVVRGVAGDDALDEFVRRLAFIVASGNNDAHLKNWSFLYRDTVTASLAPLYDQVATVAWPKLDRQLALKFASTREFGRVGRESFRRLACAVGLDPNRTWSLVREHIARLRSVWLHLPARSAVPDSHVEALQKHWERVPLLREFGKLS